MADLFDFEGDGAAEQPLAAAADVPQDTQNFASSAIFVPQLTQNAIIPP
jgi:hypothetical protein